MKRFLLLLLLVLLGLGSPVAAKTLTKVAAVVNNDIISSYQLEKEVLVALAKDANGNQLTGKQFDELQARVLEQLINEKLVDQQILAQGLTVPDAELDAAIEDVQRKNNLTSDNLKAAVEAQGMTFEEYRNQIKQEILRYKLLGREVNYKVEVTSGEIRDYFREHIDEYRTKPKVRVSSISFEVPADTSAAELDALVLRAEAARARLLEGEDFDTVLVAQGSDVFGGDMGDLVEDDLTEQLRQVLAGLDVSEVSEPVQINNQLHVFVVTARNPGDINLYDRVKGEIEKAIENEKTELRFNEWAEELRQNSYIDIRI